MRKVKGRTKNKKQRAAAEAAAERADLEAAAEALQRAQAARDGSSVPRTREPTHNGRGGKRQKLDTDGMSPRSKAKIEGDRARQRAAAELAAALPKNPAMHGPAVAAFMQHPKGKRAMCSEERIF